MDYKQTVKTGYNKIARRYLEDRTLDSQDVRLLDGLIERLPQNAKVLDVICSYYAIIHIPRQEHRPLLVNFHRMLKPGGFGLLCLGAVRQKA